MATESDNVNSGALGTLLAIGTVAMLGISLVVTALVRSEMTDEAEKKEVGADRPFRDLVAEQTAKMLGQEDPFSRAMIENQFKNFESQLDQLLNTGETTLFFIDAKTMKRSEMPAPLKEKLMHYFAMNNEQ